MDVRDIATVEHFFQLEYNLPRGVSNSEIFNLQGALTELTNRKLNTINFPFNELKITKI
jgi:hypothetical protein